MTLTERWCDVCDTQHPPGVPLPACHWPDGFDPWELIYVKQNYGRRPNPLQLKRTGRGDWEPLTDTELEAMRIQALPKAQIEAAPTPNPNGVVL